VRPSLLTVSRQACYLQLSDRSCTGSAIDARRTRGRPHLLLPPETRAKQALTAGSSAGTTGHALSRREDTKRPPAVTADSQSALTGSGPRPLILWLWKDNMFHDARKPLQLCV